MHFSPCTVNNYLIDSWELTILLPSFKHIRTIPLYPNTSVFFHNQTITLPSFSEPDNSPAVFNRKNIYTVHVSAEEMHFFPGVHFVKKYFLYNQQRGPRRLKNGDRRLKIMSGDMSACANTRAETYPALQRYERRIGRP